MMMIIIIIVIVIIMKIIVNNNHYDDNFNYNGRISYIHVYICTYTKYIYIYQQIEKSIYIHIFTYIHLYD